MTVYLDEPPNPSGMCMCGCGREAPIAQRNWTHLGVRKGWHMRYIRAHAATKAAAATRNAFSVETPGPLSTPCHIWQGGVNNKGYPVRGIPGVRARCELVHRGNLAERLGRPIRARHHAHHICETPRCVNPDHLVELTPKQHKARHPRRKAVAA